MIMYTMPGWRRKKTFSVQKNEKQCLRVSSMLWGLNSVHHHLWYSPVSRQSNRCWPRMLCSLSSSGREKSHFQKERNSPSPLGPLQQPQSWFYEVLFHEVTVPLGVTRYSCFHKGKQSSRKSQLPLQNIIHPLRVCMRTLPGHCSFLILSVKEMLVINPDILMKDYTAVSGMENCNVFKCLTQS